MAYSSPGPPIHNEIFFASGLLSGVGVDSRDRSRFATARRNSSINKRFDRDFNDVVAQTRCAFTGRIGFRDGEVSKFFAEQCGHGTSKARKAHLVLEMRAGPAAAMYEPRRTAFRYFMKPVPLELISNSAASPILRTRRQRVSRRYT
jgi:hypothetical protein